MSLLSDDFFDSWFDWQIELYMAISTFSHEPNEAHHESYPPASVAVIAVCNDGRKRGAIAIQGPNEYHNHRMWKCRKGLYINDSPAFTSTHEVYIIPLEVYNALTIQFK